MNKIFVSCDIIGHSKEQDIRVQRNRIATLNDIVRDALNSGGSDGVIWASGGDGGHVAFDMNLVEVAVNLIRQWRTWSIQENTPLRVVANCGEVEEMTGADGRVQMVGPGINFAGRLLACSDQSRVVVTTEFREMVEESSGLQVRFHDERTVEPTSFPPHTVCLLSIGDHFESQWDLIAPKSEHNALKAAIARHSGLDVIYHAKRLLEVNADDSDAKKFLRRLSVADWLGRDNLLSELILDEAFGEQYISTMQLIERNKGDVLCFAGDEGQTMFFVLRGELAVFFPMQNTEVDGTLRQPDLSIGPGQIAGELAFALQRRRTATMQSARETALLSFSYSDFLKSMGHSNRLDELVEFLDRKLRLRIVEHICNSTPFLIGRQSDGTANGPLADTPSPWVDLLPHFRLVELDWTTDKQLNATDSRFEETGIYILVSGTLSPSDSSGKDLIAENEPVVRINLPGEIETAARDFRLKSNVRIGIITDAGLKSFKVETYNRIIDVLRESEPPVIGHSQNSGTLNFDVFFSHNSSDKSGVRNLKKRLADAYRVKVWLDEDELRPGIPWQQLLEDGIKNSESIAILIGSDGIGPWENEEMQAALQLGVKDGRAIIPILLPDAPSQPELPLFLSNRMWVDLRNGLKQESLDLIVWGITGMKPNGK